MYAVYSFLVQYRGLTNSGISCEYILISSISPLGRLRVNMGNICVEQSKYAKAIKMYRMALDQIPDMHKGVRLRILQNIGTVFVKMGQYADAITSFEHILEEKADFKTGNVEIKVQGQNQDF